MEYYYLISTFTEPTLDKAPDRTEETFLTDCREHLSPADLQGVQAALDPARPARHPAVLEWRRRDTQIRNAAARERARRGKQDASPFLRPHEGYQVHIEQAVSEAFAAATPLDRERRLDALRWEQIAEIGGLNPFSGNAVVAHALKLKLAWRWARMDPAEGRTRLHELVNRKPTGEQEAHEPV